MIGESVGNFEIIARLGKGGMGEVWLAQQKSIKTKVAIKMLAADISTNTTHVQRFFNEAVAVSQIHHSGIVKIFDVGFHTGGQAYLVMEYLQGETLTARIKASGHLSIPQVADFGRQIASVLDATHNANITHRDLKPDNIYLVRDAELATGIRVKVLDFGIAKLDPSAGSARVTAMGLASIGTPNYMSPEQWHSLAEVDWRTDAYALGCVAFEMATGRPPFQGESMSDAAALHLTEAPPAPSSLVPGLPPAFDRLVSRLLEKEPGQRPTMRETMAVFTALGQPYDVALPTIPPTGMRSPLAPPANASAAFAQTSAATFSPGAQPPQPGASQPLGASQPQAGASQPFGQQNTPAPWAPGASQPFGQQNTPAPWAPGASQPFNQQNTPAPWAPGASQPFGQQNTPAPWAPGASQPFNQQNTPAPWAGTSQPFGQQNTPAPWAPGVSQPFAPQAGASQPFAPPGPYAGGPQTAPVTSAKPRRIGLFIAIGGLAIAGTVGAVVIGSSSGPQDSATPGSASGGAGSAVAAKPDASVAPALAAVAVDAAVATPDAAARSEVGIDAAVAPPDVIHVKALPDRKSGVAVTVRSALTLDVCFDETGAVTSVLPESAPHDVRVKVNTWRFAPVEQDGVAHPVCGPLTLQPGRKPSAGTQASGAGQAGAGRPATPTNELLPETLSEIVIAKELVKIRPFAKLCDTGNVNATITITVQILASGLVATATMNAPPDPQLRTCLEGAARRARFPKSKTGAKGSIAIQFTPRTAPANQGGANDPPY